ncbi:hypothetical protein OS493_014128 [Desmophyllum pertusum]|uniref:Carbonic anhydrase n=1 Tax=Desmophyllum pertusum TaxID=174260 RepID=A0A9X0CXL8_9CNID|nr:hypothetical protein OS493_014128 [Desmophyllum pertusum]
MNRFLLTVFLCISWTPLAFSDSPCYWKGICKSGVKQSPINIKSNDATVDKALGSFTLKNYDKKPTNINFTARNDGHTLTFVPSEDVYSVSGGGLVGNYSTAGFHLHWGSIDTQGSEHNLDGEKFAAELHFVSWNTKYSNVSEAKDKSDGLAVLGLFIKVEGANNTAFSFLEDAKRLIYKGSSKSDIPAFKLDTTLPSDQTKYFRYNGSLTIPGCQESVIWTVFNEPSRYRSIR